MSVTVDMTQTLPIYSTPRRTCKKCCYSYRAKESVRY